MKFLDSELKIPLMSEIVFSGVLAGLCAGLCGWFLIGRASITVPIVICMFIGNTAIDAGASILTSPRAFTVLAGVPSFCIFTAYWLLIQS